MSNKVHNGNARNKFLTIHKKDAQGNNVPGYPKYYSIVEAFSHPQGNEPALTNAQFAQLSDAAYTTRLNKFVQKVAQQNPGIELDVPDLKVGAVVYTAMCDIAVPVPPDGAVTDSVGAGDGSGTIPVLDNL
ncbi:MAG: hypothetical protein IPM52_13150 [Bacteroidetes bacterium]|nr:hypothetical protein [Bacteroidota bacterium]